MKKLTFTVTLILAICMTFGMAVAKPKYPKKPVTAIVPYGPGGAADLAGRTLASAVPDYLGKNLVIVNRSGAAGVVGATFVAKSRKDGYTLLISRVGANAAVPAINKKIAYTWDDFTFLGLLETNPFVLTVPPNSPYKTFDELKKVITETDTTLSYASAGIGNLQHLGMVLLLNELGVSQDRVRHIPFKGGGKAAAAAVGGHVDIFFQNISGVSSHIESGKLRALAVSTPERSSALPQVPAFRELGYANMETIIGWTGLWGPKDLPGNVVDAWTGTLQEVSKNADWIKATEVLGSTPAIMSPADTKAFVQKQYTVFSDLVTKLGLVIK